MKRSQRLGVLGLCVAMALTSVVPLMNAAAPGEKATTQKGAATQSARSVDAILKDLSATQEKIQETMPSLLSVADAKFRHGEGQKVLPDMKKMVGLMGELQGAIPSERDQESIRINRYRFMGMVAAFGDKESRETLETAAKGKGADALSAQCGLLLADWLSASDDAAAQAKVLEGFVPVAKANAESAEPVAVLGFVANVGAANADMTKKVLDVMRTNLKGPAVEATLAQMDADQAQKEMVGKPLVLAGRTSTGGKFDIGSLKGKVVLVDFWATWCGPCKAELPHVKEVYKQYHDQGFEIVGVSCDAADDVLNKFTESNEMPWTQLREEAQTDENQWHPLAKKYGVDGIPTMFLVDKQGMLRHIDAREGLEGKVKALLAEKDGATTKPAAQ